MLQITKKIDINGPVEEVWRRLAKLDDVANWSQAVTESHYSSETREGVGAERVCEVRGFGTLVEHVVDWEDGEGLTYSIDGMPRIVESALSKWQLSRKNHDQTTLTVTSSIQTRYGAIGSLMEKFALKPKLSATLDGVVAQFKHYVENEKPFTGDLATLLRPQAA